MNAQNRAIYSWNPAYNLVMRVKDSFNKVLQETLYNTPEYSEYEDNLNFDLMLKFLGDEYFDEVFSFLDVTQYREFVLLKYKGYQYIFNDNVTNDNFWELYDGLFNYCRSVVIDLKEETICLLPQNKFSNLNERKGYMLEDIQEKISKAKKVEISNKLDGSNQNYRWYNGRIIGSGSQALDPQQSWRLADGYSMITKEYEKMMEIYSNCTFMFEYISQKDAHVVLYSKDQDGLYLFGIKNNDTGFEFSYELTVQIGKLFGVKTTEVFDDTLDGIMSKVDDYTSDEKEGWVINIIDKYGKNFKVKLKVNDYVYMHKILSKLTSPNLVVEAIADDKFDDFISKVPVAHREKVNKYSQIVYNYLKHMEGIVQGYYFMAPKDDKKEFMIWIDKVVLKKYQGYVRSLYLKKQYNFLKKGTLAAPSYKKFNEILKEEGISTEEISE